MNNQFVRTISLQTIKINGIVYSSKNIESLLNTIDNSDNNETKYKYYEDIVSFLKEWFSKEKKILVHSSGSTGKPKPFYVEKEKMINSACTTCSFLNLNSNDSALLCMHIKYIAGKMVLVRALVAGLNIIPVVPCGNPLSSLRVSPDFAAMIPMQVFNSLNESHSKTILSGINNLIIGGGSIDEELKAKLRDFPNNIWSTYGMTETLSHIALRKINGENASDWYTPFDNVRISKSKENTLIIYAPNVCEQELITNDICEINKNGDFKIIGRKDNIINSGGIKIQIEEVEALLKKSINSPFMITSVPNHKFGEIVVMIIQGNNGNSNIMEICKKELSTYQIPKHIIWVKELPLTETGKPSRIKAKAIAINSL